MFNGLLNRVIRAGLHRLWCFKAWDRLLGSQDKCDGAQQCLGERRRGAVWVLCWAAAFHRGEAYCIVRALLCWSPLSAGEEKTPCRCSYVIVLLTLSCLILFSLCLVFYVCSLSCSHSLPRWRGRKTNCMTSWLTAVTQRLRANAVESNPIVIKNEKRRTDDKQAPAS